MATSDMRKSPQLSKIKLKVVNSAVTASDSDASVETNSLSADSATEQNNPPRNEKRRKKNRRGSEWEIMEGLKDGQRFDSKPSLFSGYLHKKRKWPLKGWHKRYFTIDKGILVYGKGPTEISKGKIHGTLDIGLSVISTKQKRRRIDIDAEEFIYHLKAKAEDDFGGWVQQLTAHRLYRQHILTYGTNVGALLKAVDGLHSISRTPEILSRDGSLTRGMQPPNGGRRLSIWVQESSSSLEQYNHDAAIIEQNINKLTRLLQQIESSNPIVTECFAEASTSVKKDRRKFGLKKKKSSSSKGGSVDLTMQFSMSKSTTDTDNPSPLSANSLSASQNALSSTNLPIPTSVTPTPDSLSNVDVISLSAENQMREDFITLAKQIIGSLKTLSFGLGTEKDRLKTALETEAQAPPNVSTHNIVNLKNNLNQVIQQNSDLRSRLTRIHEASDLTGLSQLEHLSDINPATKTFEVSLSYSSSCVSATEFFDAEELPPEQPGRGECGRPRGGRRGEEESEVRTRSESSSEAGSLSSGDGEGSASSGSEMGDDELHTANSVDVGGERQGPTGRRTALPCPRPPTEGLSLWNLLSRNIGKDLSQISMPVALNEPLGVLQRLCEELEYSELLDRAAGMEDPYERMVEVAAFAVSGYASTLSRAGNKPFNPLLGETYECTREDKGFRFVSEQVSHHPPISACHAESPNFVFWQDARVKTKFWGKSMEFQPVGNVNVLLPRTGDLYTWNKVTTCVHNLFGGQRWVDQYGEMKITNGRIACRLTFSKASYWSAKRHEVVGAVYDESGRPVRRLFGKWSESLYCGHAAPAARCVWRAGTLPPDHELYYGFTRFAVELNELAPRAVDGLPPTDTRLRPDQRALEEGDLGAAEALKMQLESMQRDRRKRREELNVSYEARWFSCSQADSWQYNGKYWDMRMNPGFANMQFESLW